MTTHDDIGTLRFKHDFNPNVTFSDTLRYARYEFSYLDTMPNFGTNPPTAATPLDSILVGRDAPGSSGTMTNLTNQSDVTVRFGTGTRSAYAGGGISSSPGRQPTSTSTATLSTATTTGSPKPRCSIRIRT